MHKTSKQIMSWYYLNIIMKEKWNNAYRVSNYGGFLTSISILSSQITVFVRWRVLFSIFEVISRYYCCLTIEGIKQHDLNNKSAPPPTPPFIDVINLTVSRSCPCTLPPFQNIVKINKTLRYVILYIQFSQCNTF